MKIRFLTTAAISFVTVVNAVGQSAMVRGVSDLTTGDPFRIDRGSSFAASAARAARRPPSTILPSAIVTDLEEALRTIRQNHISGPDRNAESLVKPAIASMLRALDPHSSYFDQKEYGNLLDDQRSEYSGIGSTIINHRRAGILETYIAATHPGGSAAAAELRFGDRIIAVDAERVSGMRTDLVRDKIRGAGGSLVSITFEQAATGNTVTRSLSRLRVSQPSIADAFILRDGVGYIDMSNGFSYTTVTEFDSSLAKLRGAGMRALILDLRGNPGGILEQSINVAERFLGAGKIIVSQRGRNAIDNQVWTSRNTAPETMPLVLLVDEQSASASEVVAGALQDHGRALIVGEKTFGKGLVQTVLRLPQGAGLTLTSSRYYTPSGRSIQRDYSDGSAYDYFTRKNGVPHDRIAKRTAADRAVFSGEGISPDQTAKADLPDPTEAALLDDLFLFSIEAAHSRVSGVNAFAANAEIKMPNASAASALNNPDLIDRFLAFQKAGTPSAVKTMESFIRSRLRYNLVMATAGTVMANRELLFEDPQIVAALAALPIAKQLADARSPKKSPTGRIPVGLR